MAIQTALSIVQQFRRRINQSVPSGLAAATAKGDVQLKEMITQVCEELRSMGPFRHQVRKHTITTSDGVTTYALPGDYWEMIPNTGFNEDTQYPLIGPLSDREFVFYKERGLSSPYEYVWRVAGFGSSVSASVEGRVIEIYPAPGAGETLSFEYLSANLFIPAAFFASPDQDLHDTIAADTDYCAFDPDLVKLGLRWMYMDDTSSNEAKIARAKKEFIDRAKASRYRPNASKSGNFGPEPRRTWRPIPEGNWSFS